MFKLFALLFVEVLKNVFYMFLLYWYVYCGDNAQRIRTEKMCNSVHKHSSKDMIILNSRALGLIMLHKYRAVLDLMKVYQPSAEATNKPTFPNELSKSLRELTWVDCLTTNTGMFLICNVFNFRRLSVKTFTSAAVHVSAQWHQALSLCTTKYVVCI